MLVNVVHVKQCSRDVLRPDINSAPVRVAHPASVEPDNLEWGRITAGLFDIHMTHGCTMLAGIGPCLPDATVEVSVTQPEPSPGLGPVSPL